MSSRPQWYQLPDVTADPVTTEQAIAELRHEIEVLCDVVEHWYDVARFYQFSSQHWKARAQNLSKPTERNVERKDVS